MCIGSQSDFARRNETLKWLKVISVGSQTNEVWRRSVHQGVDEVREQEPSAGIKSGTILWKVLLLSGSTWDKWGERGDEDKIRESGAGMTDADMGSAKRGRVELGRDGAKEKR